MATRTIARMFDSYADASAAVGELEAAGFARDDISLIANRQTTSSAAEAGVDTSHDSGAGTGATIGTVIGGGAGLLAGLGALAIPGLGPVVAAGWLIATLTGAGVGAAAGGLLGALTDAGVGEEHAHVYAEGVRRGGTLVTLRTDEGRAGEAEAIMARHNAVDAESRGADYRAGGWQRFDPSTDTTAGTHPTSGMGITPGMGAAAGLGTAGLGTAAGLGTTTAGGMMGTRTTPDPRTDAALLGSGAQAGPSSGLGRDGTPGNPPGTMASRAVDDAAGTNVSGARPENETHRGTTGMGSSAPDGTPGNPPGTMASRAVDDVAGTNISGARPENEKPTTVRTPRGPGR